MLPFRGHNTDIDNIGKVHSLAVMARLARVVVPGMPRHVTQRGNRRQDASFCEDDYGAYVELVAGRCREEGVAIWAYCLMPNHVHLIAVPEDQLQQMRNHGRTGRPLGNATFLERLEGVVGRVLRRRKPGRKPIFPKSP